MPNGSIKILDRIKNICKTQNGFYVAPVYLENIYSQCTAIKQIFVSVQPEHDTISAIIFPDRDILIQDLSDSEDEYEEMKKISTTTLLENSKLKIIISE